MGNVFFKEFESKEVQGEGCGVGGGQQERCDGDMSPVPWVHVDAGQQNSVCV